jgi:hypothetical protein
MRAGIGSRGSSWWAVRSKSARCKPVHCGRRGVLLMTVLQVLKVFQEGV